MQKLVRTIPLLIALGVFTTSCVSSRRYQEEVTAKQKAQTTAADETKKRREAEESRAKAEEEIQGLKKNFNELDAKHNKLQADHELQLRRNNELQLTHDRLSQAYKDLLAVNDRITNDAENRRNAVTKELSEKEALLKKRELEMADKEAELRREREALERMKGNVADLEGTKKELEKGLAEREKRVKELEASIAERDAKAKALRDKLTEALRGFQASDLSVEERNGKVYVSLSQNLLFASGSSKLDAKGVSALAKLSDVLNKSNDISILIEGHTDSDGDEKTNWKLSTDRSLSILDELIKHKVAPDRLTAAGRGEHSPVASNDTPDGKAKNRRTEIILSPKLDMIYDMLKN